MADGASIGFLHPMPAGEAQAYWGGVAKGIAAGDILLWAIVDGDGPAGTIQLHPIGKPNGAHRAEIAKLMVHPRARGRGLAKQLMATAEQAALDLDRVQHQQAAGPRRRWCSGRRFRPPPSPRS